MLTLPAFRETEYTLHQMNKTANVLRIESAAKAHFDTYCAHFEEQGFESRERRETEFSLFAAYEGKEECLFLNYFKNTKELQIVGEKDCRYFEFSGRKGASITTPQVTQLHLTDFGMSYIIRLSDGRFILIDGGREFEQDADRLYEALAEQSPRETPVIAAWILTHPHSDHYHCLFPFFARHGEKVKVERFLKNFCEADDLEHYPKLAKDDDRFDFDASEQTNIPLLNQLIEKSGAALFMPHTGQTYRIGDATFEVLASMDDTIHCSQNINASSLVFRMTLADQIVLWTADAGFSYARLPERYGSYLKSDILQVPHHGFGCGDPMIQIKGFRLIDPDVCLLPVNDYNAYRAFSGFREGTRYLMEEMGDFEMITGDHTRTLPLPYTADPKGPEKLMRAFLKGRQDAGARTWVFTNLSTAKAEDFEFSILNTTHLPQTVEIELFFEERAHNIFFIRTDAPACTLRQLSIIDPKAVSSEEVSFNPDSLQSKKIPENALFAARFICKEPIIISHKEHKETYHSIY